MGQMKNNSDVIPPPIGPRVRRLRLERSWSAEKLAREAEVTKQTILDIELERAQPHTRTLQAIARALEVDPGELLREGAA